ncbi:MAG: hypothetical protein JSV80_17685, partial [Acidobacteriota bacterium]
MNAAPESTHRSDKRSLGVEDVQETRSRALPPIALKGAPRAAQLSRAGLAAYRERRAQLSPFGPAEVELLTVSRQRGSITFEWDLPTDSM